MAVKSEKGGRFEKSGVTEVGCGGDGEGFRKKEWRYFRISAIIEI
jgi:hypothetical protein